MPLLMSVIALVGGVLLYLALRRYLATSSEGPPVLRHLEGKRIFERLLFTLATRAGKLERLVGTRRLQPRDFVRNCL